MAIGDPNASGRKGGDKDFQTEDNRGIREERGIVIGEVKANAHPASMAEQKFKGLVIVL